MSSAWSISEQQHPARLAFFLRGAFAKPKEQYYVFEVLTFKADQCGQGVGSTAIMSTVGGKYVCKSCGFATNFSNQYQVHLSKCQPLTRVEQQAWYCELCKVESHSRTAHRTHLEGARHRKNAAERDHMARVTLLTPGDVTVDRMPQKLVQGKLHPLVIWHACHPSDVSM